VAEEDWTVRRLLEWTTQFFTRKGVDDARLCAEKLLAHVLSVQRIQLYTNYDRVVTPEQLDRYRELVRRAAAQEPVAYLTGKVQFFNLEIQVTRDVLIPRPDTEVLVENIIRIARANEQWAAPRVLDLCTGSGCVAAAVAANVKTAVVSAIDISPAALAVARGNLRNLGLSERVNCQEGDLYAALDQSGEPFNLIAANPPYIASGQIALLDKSVKDFEPVAALDGGPNGLAVHRRIWASAARWLADDGHIIVEIAFDQAKAAMDALAEVAGPSSLTDVRILKDYAGRDRLVAARKK
jgi:release factor glutamine methyltransferase